MTQSAMAGELAAARPPPVAAPPARASRRLGREPARLVEAEEDGIGRLARRGVLAGGLAELGRRPLDVEDVVDDLERQAEVAAVPSIAAIASSPRAGHDGAGDARRRESARRSCARACRASAVASSAAARARGLQVDGLAADHAAGPAAAATMRDRARACARESESGRAARLAREQRERFGQQAVAGQNRHALAVTRRAPSAGRAAACRRPSRGDRRGSSE